MYSSSSSREKNQNDKCVDDVLQTFDKIILEQAQLERRKFVAFEKKKGLELRISQMTNQIEQTSMLLKVTLAHVQDEENALKEVRSTYKSLRRAIQTKMELNKLKQQQDAIKKSRADTLRSQIQARLSACIRTEESIQKTIKKKRPEFAVLKEQERRVLMAWEVVFAKNKQMCVPEVQDIIGLAVKYDAAQKKNTIRAKEHDCRIQYPSKTKETLTSVMIPERNLKYKQKEKEDSIFTLTPYSACKSSGIIKSHNLLISIENRSVCMDSSSPLHSLKDSPLDIGRPSWTPKLELFQHSTQNKSTYRVAPILLESFKENVSTGGNPTQVTKLQVPNHAVENSSISQSTRTLSFTESHKEKSSTPRANQSKIESSKNMSSSQCDKTANFKLQSPILPRPLTVVPPDMAGDSNNVLKKFDLLLTSNLTLQNRNTNVNQVSEMIAGSTPSQNSRKRNNKEHDQPKEKKIRIVPVKQSGNLNEGSQLLKMWLQKKNEISAATSEVSKEYVTPEKGEWGAVQEEKKQLDTTSNDCNKSSNQQDMSIPRYGICESPVSAHELTGNVAPVVGASGYSNGDDSASIADSGVEPDCTRSVCTTPYTPRYQFQLWTPKGKRTSGSCLDAQTTPKILKDVDGNPVKEINYLKSPDEEDSDAETPIAKPSQSSTPSQTTNKKEKVLSVSVLCSHFNKVSPIAHRSRTFPNSPWNNDKKHSHTDLSLPFVSNQSPGQVLTPRKSVPVKPNYELSQFFISSELNNQAINKSYDDEMGEGEGIVKANVDETMSSMELESTTQNLKDVALLSGIIATPKNKANVESPAPIDLAIKANSQNQCEFSRQDVPRETVEGEDDQTKIESQTVQSSMDHQMKKEVFAINFVKSPAKIDPTSLSEVKPKVCIEKQEESLKGPHDISIAETKDIASGIQPDKVSQYMFDFAEKANPIPFAQDFFFASPKVEKKMDIDSSPSFFDMFKRNGSDSTKDGAPGTDATAVEGMVFSFAFASEDSSSKANETNPFSFFND